MPELKVYEAIAAITGELAKEGISKDRKNAQQGFAFRGIDDIYDAMSPLLSKYRLCIIPRVMSRDVTERTTKSGGALFYTTLSVEFDFVAAEDGSKHTACTVGEAMDSADKSSSKAMSAAYKYVCFQVFCIPIEGTPDADEVKHEVAPAKTVREQTIENARGAIKATSKAEFLPAISKKIKLSLAEGKITEDDVADLMQELSALSDLLQPAAV